MCGGQRLLLNLVKQQAREFFKDQELLTSYRPETRRTVFTRWRPEFPAPYEVGTIIEGHAVSLENG